MLLQLKTYSEPKLRIDFIPITLVSQKQVLKSLFYSDSPLCFQTVQGKRRLTKTDCSIIDKERYALDMQLIREWIRVVNVWNLNPHCQKGRAWDLSELPDLIWVLAGNLTGLNVTLPQHQSSVSEVPPILTSPGRSLRSSISQQNYMAGTGVDWLGN